MCEVNITNTTSAIRRKGINFFNMHTITLQNSLSPEAFNYKSNELNPETFLDFHLAFLGKQFFDIKQNRAIKNTYVFWRNPKLALNMAKQYLVFQTVPFPYKITDKSAIDRLGIPDYTLPKEILL